MLIMSADFGYCKYAAVSKTYCSTILQLHELPVAGAGEGGGFLKAHCNCYSKC